MLQPLTVTRSCSSLTAPTLSSVIRGPAGIAVNTIYSRGHQIFKGSSLSFARFSSVLFCEQSHLSVNDYNMVGNSCVGLLFSFGYRHRTNMVFNWVVSKKSNPIVYSWSTIQTNKEIRFAGYPIWLSKWIMRCLTKLRSLMKPSANYFTFGHQRTYLGC